MSKRNVFCPKCGNSISVDDTREYFFCNKCGSRGVVPKIKQQQTSVKQEKKINVIPSLCTRCNGTLKFSADRESAVCEYCGATYTNKTVYVSRDETEIQRAEYEAQKRKLELEAEERKRKLEIEAEERRRQEERELEEKRVKRARIVTEIWSWVLGLILYISFIVWAVRRHNGLESYFLIGVVIVAITIYFMIIMIVNTKQSEENKSSQCATNDSVHAMINNRIQEMKNEVANDINSDFVDLGNYKNTKNTNNVAKNIATGAAIGTGIAAAGLAFKGIRKLLK